MTKRLFCFWSNAEPSRHLFALLPDHLAYKDAESLASAATADANREDLTRFVKNLQVFTDKRRVEEDVKEVLTRLGFEFVESAASLCSWETHDSDETLLQARLRLAGVQFTVACDGNLTIETRVGDIAVNVAEGTWSGQGTTGSIAGTIAVGWLIQLIELRNAD